MLSSNAFNVVNEVKSNKDPEGWYTRYAILHIRSNFGKKQWCLNWNARSSNGLADLVAKHTLKWNVYFDMDHYHLITLPVKILDVVARDKLGGRDGCNQFGFTRYCLDEPFNFIYE